MRILLSSTVEQVLRDQLMFFETVLKDSGLDILCVQPGENITGVAKIMMIGRVAKKRGDLKSFVRKEQTHIFLTKLSGDISEAARGRGFEIVTIDPISDKTSLKIWEFIEHSR